LKVATLTTVAQGGAAAIVTTAREAGLLSNDRKSQLAFVFEQEYQSMSTDHVPLRVSHLFIWIKSSG
jgi:hypothetical protein